MYIYMATWALTGKRNATRIRENYLRAVLRQDIAYFDTPGDASKVKARIQSNMRKQSNYFQWRRRSLFLSSCRPCSNGHLRESPVYAVFVLYCP